MLIDRIRESLSPLPKTYPTDGDFEKMFDVNIPKEAFEPPEIEIADPPDIEARLDKMIAIFEERLRVAKEQTDTAKQYAIDARRTSRWATVTSLLSLAVALATFIYGLVD